MANIHEIGIAAYKELETLIGVPDPGGRRPWVEGVIDCLASLEGEGGDVESMVKRAKAKNPDAFKLPSAVDRTNREVIMVSDSEVEDLVVRDCEG